VATEYAQLFKGAIYNCGVNFWKTHPPRALQQIRQNHYVFLTGSRDQARMSIKKVYKQYPEAGVSNSKLMVISNMTHRNPDADDFEEAIRYFDSRFTP
jgi:hypothetical protein